MVYFFCALVLKYVSNSEFRENQEAAQVVVKFNKKFLSFKNLSDCKSFICMKHLWYCWDFFEKFCVCAKNTFPTTSWPLSWSSYLCCVCGGGGGGGGDIWRKWPLSFSTGDDGREGGREGGDTENAIFAPTASGTFSVTERPARGEASRGERASPPHCPPQSKLVHMSRTVTIYRGMEAGNVRLPEPLHFFCEIWQRSQWKLCFVAWFLYV